MNPSISIIVPVFNVEAYLGPCLESLRRQTRSDVEIICVDDASTDGSPSILADAKRDPRVSVIRHSSNRGLSAARNTGIRAARSPWVLFVDSDDLVSSRLCERALAAATQHRADAVFFNYAVFRDGQPAPPESAPGPAAPVDRAALLQRPAFAWTKLIRADLMRGNSIQFPEGLYFEDTLVHWRLAIESERPVFLDEALVYYRQRQSSITYRKDWTRADAIRTCDRIKEYLQESGRWAEWRDLFLRKQLTTFANTHAYYVWANPAFTERVRQEVRARMTSEHWDIVNDGCALKRWQRDYLVSRCRASDDVTSSSILLSLLRSWFRDQGRMLLRILLETLRA